MITDHYVCARKLVFHAHILYYKIASKFSAINYMIVTAAYAEVFTFLSR